MTTYTRANAEAILSVITGYENCHWLPVPSTSSRDSSSPIYVNDQGIFPNVTSEDEFRWKPCHELPDGPDKPDCAGEPGLPFPFTANQLAAWMLNGVGALVASAFGNLVEREPVDGEPADQPTVLGPDFSVLTDPDANKAREAVQAAFDAYRNAVASVGKEPKTQSQPHALAQVRDAEHATWLAAMVQHLLTPASNSSEVQQEDACVGQEADNQKGKKIDYKALATPDQLLFVFEVFGLKPAHFKKLQGPLLRAQKASGRPGRGGHPGWFCPYEVMTWLAKGKRYGMSDTTGWRLLKRHFPNAYAKFCIGDPNA